MSYENAPSTKMIAEFCAYCSRPLRRPDSVETGVGPECGKRYGHDVATGPADWSAANRALSGALELLPEGWDEDQSKVASALVHRIACAQHGPGVVACVNAIRALGYPAMADRIAHRIARIEIREEGEVLMVKTPFDEAAVAVMRTAPGRYVGKGIREVPHTEAARRALWGVLRAAYPNALVSGPKGVFQLAA